jgi:hypothetical protein
LNKEETMKMTLFLRTEKGGEYHVAALCRPADPRPSDPDEDMAPYAIPESERALNPFDQMDLLHDIRGAMTCAEEAAQACEDAARTGKIQIGNNITFAKKRA